MIHYINPRFYLLPIDQREVHQSTVIEPWIPFQPVDICPVPDWNLYQFDSDLRFPRRDKCRESPSRVIERPGNRCDSARNGIPAETFIAFAGTECTVCGDQDSFFFHLRLLFLIK